MSLDELKALGIGAFSSKYSRDELAAYIVAQHETGANRSDQIEINRIDQLELKLDQRLTDLPTAMGQVKQDLKKERERSEKLERAVASLTDTVSSQQRYLERLDARDRTKNLIVLGLPEVGFQYEGADSDSEKIDALVHQTRPNNSSSHSSR